MRTTDQKFIERQFSKLLINAAECLGNRQYKVTCSECRLQRLVKYDPQLSGQLKCNCMKLSLPQTFENHAKKVAEKHPTYECLSFEKHPKKCTYRHKCGHIFQAQSLGFLYTDYPCAECRPSRNKTAETFKKQFENRGFVNAILQSAYMESKSRVIVGFKNCDHTVDHYPDYTLRYFKETIDRCPKCFPTWQRVAIDGKDFRLRSAVEKRFIEFLVNVKKVPIQSIEYEPRDCKIPYCDPITKEAKVYSPDFKVKGKIMEVKNLGSMGLTQKYRDKNGMEVLKVNQAKVRAAKKIYGKVEVYVEVKGNFILVDNFERFRSQSQLLEKLNAHI